MGVAACKTFTAALISVTSRTGHVAVVAGGDVEARQVINASPAVLPESDLSIDAVCCARVPVSDLSRLKLGSHSSARKITLVSSEEIQEKSHKKFRSVFTIFFTWTVPM